jgi:hypothetical protein
MKGLMTLLVLSTVAGSAWAGSGSHDALRLPSAPGVYGSGQRDGNNVLVVRDYIPWGGDIVPEFTDRGSTVTVITAEELRTADLSSYCLVYITGGQTQTFDETSQDLNSLAARNNVQAFVENGGAVLFDTASWGATLRLPGGVISEPDIQGSNLFTGVNPLSADMPFPQFDGIEASHDVLLNLPETAQTYITTLAGSPTGAEYGVGTGRVLALTMPFEYYLGDAVGGESYPHMLTLLDNAVEYSLSLGACDGQVQPGRLALTTDALDAFVCVGETYEPALGTLSFTLANAGGSPCENVQAILVGGAGLTVVGEGVQSAGTLFPGEEVVLTFQVAPYGTPCDVFLHYDLLVTCDTCTPVQGSGRIWTPCCGTVDAVTQPGVFALRGNHPNPFNPSTTVSYSLDQTGPATLSVFSLAGERVAVLAEGNQEAGEHQVAFDGSRLASGLYLLRLEAGAQLATGRMLLIK